MTEFDYRAPKSLDKALELKRRYGSEARFLAGGTNLVPGLRAGSPPPGLLIDLNRIKGMDFVSIYEDSVSIGPLVRVDELLSEKRDSTPFALLFEAAKSFGNPLIRNRATVAGNLADASPAADMAVPLLALDAQLTLASDAGERKLPLESFFLGPNRTDLEENELITEIRFPLNNGSARPYYKKLGLRNADAISIVSVAMLLDEDKGRCKNVRVAFGAVAPVPLRAKKAEAFLEGTELTQEGINDFGGLAAEEASPIDDIRASAGYRRRMVSVLAGRGLAEITGQQR